MTHHHHAHRAERTADTGTHAQQPDAIRFGRIVRGGLQPALALTLVAGLTASHASAQAQVDVNTGETLTEADLSSGMFTGAAQKFNFTLDLGTVFDVNDGGVIGPAGDGSTDPVTPFDFGGSTVNINSGGLFDSFASNESVVSNINMNVVDGGSVGERFDVGSGSLVNISGGSVEDGFKALAGSRVNISGGFVGRVFQALNGSEVNISGGNVGFAFIAGPGSVVNITGGNVGPAFLIDPGSEVNISGGSVGNGARASGGSTVNISGGSVGDNFDATSSTVNISGGNVGDDFDAFFGSTVNLFVTAIQIDGVDLGLSFEDPTVIINQRGGSLLEATLADESDFDLKLNDTFVDDEDFISSGATLTVTLVPSPGAAGVLGVAGLLAVRRRRRG